MARGRFITNEIVRDKRINNLCDDTSRLAFTWLVAFADKEGRVYGDPALVRSLLFPRRDDLSVEDMEIYILEWHSIGLITWYEADDDLWICFPNFDKHQVGLRKDREPDSQIPHPDSGTLPEVVRNIAGSLPEENGLIKVNVIKDNIKGIKEGESKNDSQTPKPKPPPKPKKGKKRDPLLDHPAIIAYKDEARLHVPITWREEVCRIVDDAEKWKELVHLWIGKGWNKQNVEGMLQAYVNGGINKQKEEPAGFPAIRNVRKKAGLDNG